MSDIYRTVLRVRRAVGTEVTRLRRIPEAIAVLLASVVVAGIIRATASGADWAEILRGQAINVVSAVILAGFAYLLFVLRFRRAQLNTYLERYQIPVALGAYDTELSALAKTIVDELLDAKPPHAALIIGPADAAYSRLLGDVADRLAGKRRVPVLVDLAAEDAEGSLPALTRDRFIGELVGSSGDAQSGRRLYASLVRRRRVVALVRGLDRVGQGKSLGARRAAMAEMLEDSLGEGIPFVAWVPQDLAPSISEVAAFRTRPLPRSDLVAYTLRQLAQREVDTGDGVESILTHAFDEGEPSRDPALLDLAADVVARRIRGGSEGPGAIRDLFGDPSVFRRHLGWMCEWTLDCRLDEIADASSPAALALATIGKEAHYRQESELNYDDALSGLDADGRRRFAAGVALLSQRGVLTLSPAGGGTQVRFAHPAWFGFAGTLGLKLDSDSWRDLLRPGAPSATLDALAGALVIFGVDILNERSFVRVLRQVGLRETAEISLEMAVSVITALQTVGEPLDLGEDEQEALRHSWSTAGDVVKLRFVSDVHVELNPQLIDVLWAQVTPPQFAANSFRVRRAICTRLGGLGSSAWTRLGPAWRELVDEAGRGDLSSAARKNEHWRRYGPRLASLGWVIPSVLRTVDPRDEREAFDLAATMRGLMHHEPNGDSSLRSKPEIGLEISLAEGFKAAAVESVVRREGCDQRWCSEARRFLDSSRSWTSKQALLQALGLVLGETGPDQVRELAERWEGLREEHPFVRETAALVRRAVEGGKGPGALTERDIWFEEVEALDDGGVNLSPEAHRLLGLSTLLINLAEWRFREWRDDVPAATPAAIDARERAFTGRELPTCFLRSSHAATMFRADCDCPFKFCGAKAKLEVLGESRPSSRREARRFSRSFLQRAQATARARAVMGRDGGPGFAGKALEPVWRELDDEVAALEARNASVTPKTWA